MLIRTVKCTHISFVLIFMVLCSKYMFYALCSVLFPPFAHTFRICRVITEHFSSRCALLSMCRDDIFLKEV